MAKTVGNSVLDGALIILASNIVRMTATAGQPTTFACATTSGVKMLASITVSGADFVIADGDGSGRKVTIGQKTGASVTNTGGANHVALTTAASLEYVTTATSQQVTAGNSLTFNSWKIEIADPT